MTAQFLLVFVAGSLAGGFINGLAGFGTALFALSFWLQILSAEQAVTLAVIMSVLSSVQGIWVVRQDIRNQPRRLMRFLVPGFLGVPLGVTLLSLISTELLKAVIASVMILYGGFFLTRRNLPHFVRPTPIVDSLIGFAGGVLGGAASLSGALPTMWCAMRPWTKGETRAVLQPYNFAILFVTLPLLIWNGYLTQETLILVAIAFLPTQLGVHFGIFLFGRLRDAQFRYLLIIFMFLSGSILAIHELI